MEKINYQSLIISEFEGRKNRNPRYSLRSFAENIGISPGRLSQILRGKSGISVRSAKVVSFRLFNDEKQRELFLTLVEAKQSKSEIVRKQAQGRLDQWFSNESMELSFDKFTIIKNWYHFSILEMTELSFFKSDLDWIAGQLDISRQQAADAVLRLSDLGLLDVSKDPWRQTEKELGTVNGISNQSVREHHKQILLKMHSKVDSTPLEERYLNSTTMAIDTKKLPQAKKALQEFRDKFCRNIQDSNVKDAVYCLSIQLFPITKNEIKN
ncbi:MAG: TIGR02147 family protein [Bdellovibrionales bacterium]